MLELLPYTRLVRLLTFFGVEYGKEEPALQRDVFPFGTLLKFTDRAS